MKTGLSNAHVHLQTGYINKNKFIHILIVMQQRCSL